MLAEKGYYIVNNFERNTSAIVSANYGKIEEILYQSDSSSLEIGDNPDPSKYVCEPLSGRDEAETLSAVCSILAQ